MVGTLPIQVASIGIPDTLFLMLLALVVFGPRRLPEIGRQIGKLMYEFRKVSNDFKYQMEEELRASEEAERQRKLAAAPAPQATSDPYATDPAISPATDSALLPSQMNRASALMAAVTVPYPDEAPPIIPPAFTQTEPAALPEPAPLQVQPPSQGDPVEAARPFRGASLPHTAPPEPTPEPSPATGEAEANHA